jgi:hypothetical protein
MSEQQDDRRGIWRWLLAAGVVVLLVGGWFGYISLRMRAKSKAAEAELREAIAETDRLDPGWRLEELEAKRARPSDPDNGALCVRRARALLPAHWPDPDESQLHDSLIDVPRNHLLSPQQAQDLGRLLDKVTPAVAEARRLAGLRQGRFSVTWSEDIISTKLPHLQQSRELLQLLELDAQQRGQNKDPAGMLLTCRAMINVGRAIGDEPSTISQLVHLAASHIAVSALARGLALGEPPPEALRLTQELLEEESKHPAFLIMLRGERIWSHCLLSGLSSDPEKWKKHLVWNESGIAELIREARPLHPRVLRLYSQAIEIAKLPAHLWKDRLDELEKAEKDTFQPIRPFVSIPQVFARSCKRFLATLRAAAVALAVERFRQAHGHWPTSLAELKPALVREIPLDPFDGKPLRFRRVKGGVVVYSIGEDEKDDGGSVERDPISGEPGTDLGVRLWDVSKRRLPPVPPPPPPPEVEKP